jgi:hypothetical protein
VVKLNIDSNLKTASNRYLIDALRQSIGALYRAICDLSALANKRLDLLMLEVG